MTDQLDNIRRPDTTANPGHFLPRTENVKFGVWFFLGGEIVLFTALIMTFALFRIRYASQYADFRSHLNVLLVGANTLILIASSYLVVRALQAIRSGSLKGMLYNLMGVLALGAVFIGGQAFEWSELFNNGVNLKATFGSPFFIMTGIHGSHVLIGLAWCCFVMMSGLDQSPIPKRTSHGMEIFGLYWHFVDIVWIVLFSVIYLV